MKTQFRSAPREFTVGDVTIRDQGSVVLDPEELLTLETPTGRQCDVTAKNWGFYLGSSLNSRLPSNGFRVALVRNPSNKIFVNVVESDQLEAFRDYLKREDSVVICWLDEWFPKTED